MLYCIFSGVTLSHVTDADNSTLFIMRHYTTHASPLYHIEYTDNVLNQLGFDIAASI